MVLWNFVNFSSFFFCNELRWNWGQTGTIWSRLMPHIRQIFRTIFYSTFFSSEIIKWAVLVKTNEIYFPFKPEHSWRMGVSGPYRAGYNPALPKMSFLIGTISKKCPTATVTSFFAFVTLLEDNFFSNYISFHWGNQYIAGSRRV